jgi:hypothetical protein
MKYRVPVVLIALLAAALLWLLPAHPPVPVAARPALVPTAKSTPSALPHADPTGARHPEAAQNTGAIPEMPQTSGVNRGTPASAGFAAASRERASGPEVGPGLKPETVLENMRSVFRQYSDRFGGNPVGTNLEITRALNGKNPGKVVFLKPEDGMRVNDRGELIDNWGTPFFFHQLSGTVMEIHSAGPDRKMWTSDDLVIR